MTSSVVVMVEEPSMRIIVDILCRKLDISEISIVLQHDGKSDLEKSISRKITGWRSPMPAHFVVSRDLDSADRNQLRTKLLSLVPPHALARTKIRIIVPELESWYLGDPKALVDSGLISLNVASRIRSQAKFRNLCSLSNAKQEFKKIVGHIGQLSAAHQVGPFLEIERNTCRNFHAFVEALKWASDAVRR